MAINGIDRVVSSSSPIVDANGTARAKSSSVLDLSRLHLLQKQGKSLQLSKDKNVAASVLGPVPSDSPFVIAEKLGVRVSSIGDMPAFTDAQCSTMPNSNSLSNEVPAVSKLAIPATSSTVETPSSPSWVAIVTGDTKPHVHPLKFITPVFDTDSSALSIPSALVQLGREKFSLCLVGQFMGQAPNVGLINAMAARLWGRQGTISVIPYKAGLFLFQFPNNISLSRALFGGPWHIGGIPLLRRQWSSTIEPVDFKADTFPVWVQLRNVPPELLTCVGLSYLASAIGKPLHTSQDYSKVFSDRANICVDVNFSKPLINSLPITIDGCLCTIEISYSWKPQFCDLCQCWGHHQLGCTVKKAVTTQWVPKLATTAKATDVPIPAPTPMPTEAPIPLSSVEESILPSDAVTSTFTSLPPRTITPVSNAFSALARPDPVATLEVNAPAGKSPLNVGPIDTVFRKC
ncbi:hypothetical protein Tsubulata_003089 [Turnera subulata]|uniref:DUF4283 domain-containing protein n=1 Tax=Turnera subulata TaxID=218843 RepID=A0A9Q0G618_9ROSI|nr:hypothetical protein Tsubulata_003089 [Turnera subulata]